MLRGLQGLEPGCPALRRVLGVTLDEEEQTSLLAHLEISFLPTFPGLLFSSVLKGSPLPLFI